MPLRCQVWTTVGNTLFYQHFNQRDCRLNLGQLASDFSAGVICNLLSYDLQRSRCYAEKNTASRCVQKGTHHTVCIASFNSPVDFFSSRVRVSSFLMSSCISALVIIVVTFVFANL